MRKNETDKLDYTALHPTFETKKSVVQSAFPLVQIQSAYLNKSVIFLLPSSPNGIQSL
jgi:hypothetical protein